MSTTDTSPDLPRRICKLLADIQLAIESDPERSKYQDEPYFIRDEAQQHYDSLVGIFAEPIEKGDLDAIDSTYREVLRIISPVARDRLHWFLDQFVNVSVKLEKQTSEHTLTLGVAASADLMVNPYEGKFLDVTPIADYLSRELDVPAAQIAVNSSPFYPGQYFAGVASYVGGLALTKSQQEVQEFNAKRAPMPLLHEGSDEEALPMVFVFTLHLQNEQALSAAKQKLHEHQTRIIDENGDFETIVLQYEGFDDNAAPAMVNVDLMYINVPFSLLFDMVHVDIVDEFNEAIDDLVSDEFAYLDTEEGEQRETPGYRPGQLGMSLSLHAGPNRVLDSEARGRFEIYDIATKIVLYVGEGACEEEHSVLVDTLTQLAIHRELGEIRDNMEVIYRADQDVVAAPAASA
jgi:hypothetical protein